MQSPFAELPDWKSSHPNTAVRMMVGYNLMYVALPLALAPAVSLFQGTLPWNSLILSGLLLMAGGVLLSMKRLR
ncbi:MAG: hypothetical protein ACX931_12435 [Saccharospirillum sp.]